MWSVYPVRIVSKDVLNLGIRYMVLSHKSISTCLLMVHSSSFVPSCVQGITMIVGTYPYKAGTIF